MHFLKVFSTIYVKPVLPLLFCTYGVNIFIDYRPACRDKEKGGKGERDTGMITRNGVTSCVAEATCAPAACGGREAPIRGPPPPHTPTSLGQISTASLDLEDGL
jgi:hypothetical protein